MSSVRVALRVLEDVAFHQPVGVSEVARRLGLSKTTTQRALAILHDADWIEPAEEARTAWALSIRALVVGGHAVDSRRGLRSIAVPVMEELRRRTEETVHLFVRSHDRVVLVERLDGIKPVRVFNPLGGYALLHRTSSGKAVMAHLKPDELAAYLARPMTTGSTHAPIDPDDLRRELDMVRAWGFAVNLAQNQPDVSAVGAPIFDEQDNAIGAITISAPPERLVEAACMDLGPVVSDAARRITLGMRLRR
ncbi:MAG: IclR family transcriptional regulator [Caulobacterales bacterium]